MKKIVLASNNKHKYSEIKAILDNVELLTLEDIGFKEEIEESGNTFLENALIKAKTVSEFLKNRSLEYDVLADDSGLCCIALDGYPGIYSARYSGEHGNDQMNRNKLIEELRNKEKKAYFNCTLILYSIDNTYKTAVGETYGEIIEKEKGDTSFGYDCIFLSEELGKTFGEATNEEKNTVSHRYKALLKLKDIM